MLRQCPAPRLRSAPSGSLPIQVACQASRVSDCVADHRGLQGKDAETLGSCFRVPRTGLAGACDPHRGGSLRSACGRGARRTRAQLGSQRVAAGTLRSARAARFDVNRSDRTGSARVPRAGRPADGNGGIDVAARTLRAPDRDGGTRWRIASMQRWSSARGASLRRRDPVLGDVIRRVGACGLRRAAAIRIAIWCVRCCSSRSPARPRAARSRSDCTRSYGGRVPAPAQLRVAETETLRGAGLSRQKIESLRAIATAFDERRLDARRLARLDDDAVVEAVTRCAASASGPRTCC